MISNESINYSTNVSIDIMLFVRKCKFMRIISVRASRFRDKDEN